MRFIITTSEFADILVHYIRSSHRKVKGIEKKINRVREFE